MRLNSWGNQFLEGKEIYTIEILVDGQHHQKGTKVEVLDSWHPSFKNHWQCFRGSHLFYRKEDEGIKFTKPK